MIRSSDDMRESRKRKQEKTTEPKSDWKKIPCPKHDVKLDEWGKEQEDYMVLRTVYLKPSMDTRLRKLAFDAGIGRNELIRTILMANPKVGNCKKCAEDLEKWKTIAFGTPGRRRVLDDKVAGARLDEVVEKMPEVIVKRETQAERRRVAWFARVIAELAMDYGKVLFQDKDFQDKDFLKWLTQPLRLFAKEAPAMLMWREGMVGLKKVKRELDRRESDGFN